MIPELLSVIDFGSQAFLISKNLFKFIFLGTVDTVDEMTFNLKVPCIYLMPVIPQYTHLPYFRDTKPKTKKEKEI